MKGTCSCLLLILLAAALHGEPAADPLHMYLRTDPRLQVRLDVSGYNPPLEEVLDKLREATGLKFTVAKNLKGHDPQTGAKMITSSNKAFVLDGSFPYARELVAAKTAEDIISDDTPNMQLLDQFATVSREDKFKT